MQTLLAPTRKIFYLIAVFVLLNQTSPALAHSPQWLGEPLNLTQARTINKAQAAAIAQGAYGGKVLKVSTSKRKGKTFFLVKLLQKSGRVRLVSVDGANGQISGG